jgi:PAS domain S-box-containing protein
MKKKHPGFDFELFFEYSIDLLCIADINGNFIKLNPEWVNVLGYRLQELEGKPFIQFVHPEDIESTINATQQLAGQSKVLNFTNRYRCKDGSYRWIEWRSYPANNLIYAVARDITERIIAEKKIRESELKYHKLFNNMTSGFAFHEMVFDSNSNPIDFRFIDINNKYKEIWDIDDSIIGKTAFESFEVADKKWIADAWKVITSGQPSTNTRRMPNKDMYVETTLFKVDNTHFAAIFNDITEKNKALAQLQASEQKFSNIYNLSPDMVGITRQSDGKIITGNSKFSILTGYTSDEYLGKTTLELGLWADPSDRNKILVLLKEVGEVVNIEMGMKIKGGAVLTCLFSAKLIDINNEPCLLFVVHDITERKNAEELLRKSEARLQKAQAVGKIGYSEQVIGEQRVWVSAEAKSIYGFPPVDGFLSLTDVKDRIIDKEIFLRAYSDILEHGNKLDIEFRIDPADGTSMRYIHAVSDLERDTNGNPYKIISIFQDITQRKIAEEALQKRVMALTKPLDDPEGVNFTDLFDIDELQKIQDGFAEATGVASLITYPDGTPITQPSNFCKLCNMIRKTKAGAANCFKSDAFLGKQNPNGPTIQPCLSGGLWDAGASITVGGKHIANWLIGQVRNEAQDEVKILEYADFIGIGREEFKQALKKVPAMPTEQFEKVSQSLYILANQLSLKAYQNVQQARFIAEQKQAEEALKKREEQFRGITQNIPGIVFQFYAKKNGEIGLKFVSDASIKYLGFDNKELDGLLDRFAAGIIDKDRAGFFKSIDDAIKSVSAWSWEGSYIKPDGEKMYFRGVSHPHVHNDDLLFDGIILDISDKKRAEETLRQLADLHQTILDTVSAGLAFIKDRKHKWVNTYYCKMFGYAQEEMLDAPTSINYVNKDEYEKVGTEGYLQLSKGEVYSTTILSRCKNGKEIWVNLSGKALNPHDLSEGSIWMLQDITERKKSEEALREKDAILRSIFHGAPVAIGLIIDRNFQECNDTFFAMTGYQPNEIIGKNANIIYPTIEEYNFIGQEQLRQIQGQNIETVETRWLKKDGTIINILLRFIPLDLTDLSKGITFTALDITRRKKAEENLYTQQILNNALMDSLPGLMYLYDADGYLKHWNKRHETETGYSAEELLNKHVLSWYEGSETDIQVITKGLENTFNTGYGQAEAQLQKKDGTRVYYYFTAVKVEIENQLYFIGFGLDISERKRIEEEIRSLNINLEKKVADRTLKLEQANKDLEAFAYSVSHDLRAPLRHIDGFARLMYSNINNPSETVTNYSKKIKMASSRLSSMIDELLSFSRLGRKDLLVSPVDLSNLMSEIIENLKPDYINRNIKWILGKLPVVNGDHNLLHVAFENLLSNAIKYTAKKEHAIIEIGTIEKLVNQNKMLIVFVKDNGAGFDMAYANKLFGVFQRLHSNEEFEGIGIGLANVKQIIQKHKWTITAESEVNKGATFYISLPKT